MEKFINKLMKLKKMLMVNILLKKVMKNLQIKRMKKRKNL
jgi:hypothetical protein